MLFKNLSRLGLLLGLILLVSCSEDDGVDETGGNGTNTTSVYITDSPVDQAEVEAVFITVSGVKVNGKAIEGFNTTTIEISSLTNGRTELLGELDLAAGSTSDISLMLADTRASGEGAGNYVVTANGSTEIMNVPSEIKVSEQTEIIADAQNEIVLDFDLRKTLKQEGDSYGFVSETELENGIRVVNTLNTGIVTGKVQDVTNGNGEVIIAYAYKDGSFQEGEIDENAEGIRFSNAVSSSKVVQSSGEFEIHYLNEGDYELHFASYSDKDSDGKLEFSGIIDASTTGNLDLEGFKVEANSEVNLQISFAGLLGL